MSICLKNYEKEILMFIFEICWKKNGKSPSSKTNLVNVTVLIPNKKKQHQKIYNEIVVNGMPNTVLYRIWKNKIKCKQTSTRLTQ